MKAKKTLRDYLGQVLNISPDKRRNYWYYVRDGKECNVNEIIVYYSVRNAKMIKINGDQYQVNCLEKDYRRDRVWRDYLRICRDFEEIPEEALDKYIGI